MDPNMENWINFRDGPIDELTIHYADLSALRLQGILSIDNYDHLKLIPKDNLADVHIVISVFQTILRKHKGKLSLILEFHLSNAPSMF
jgi:hypothetical protein